MSPSLSAPCRLADLLTANYFRLANDKWYGRFTRAAKDTYGEMGLLSISVVAYTGKSGQLVIDMCVVIWLKITFQIG